MTWLETLIEHAEWHAEKTGLHANTIAGARYELENAKEVTRQRDALLAAAKRVLGDIDPHGHRSSCPVDCFDRGLSELAAAIRAVETERTNPNA